MRNPRGFKTLPNIRLKLSEISTRRANKSHTINKAALELLKKQAKRPSITRLLQPSREQHLEGSMQSFRGTVGMDAKLDFFSTYRSLPRVSQRNTFQNLEKTPSTAFLEQVEKTGIVPKPFGLARREGSETNIDVRLQGIGDLYANALSKGVIQLSDVKKLNLDSNRLSEKGCATVLDNIRGSNLDTLSLANNRVGEKAANLIIDLLSDRTSRLKVLDLEACHLSEDAVIGLCRAISENNRMKTLNLAKNGIRHRAGRALALVIHESQTLQNLDLHWNCIQGEVAVEVFKALADNDSLLALDLSWNTLGRGDSKRVAKSIGEFLVHNTFLRHLDLSYNYLSRPECAILGNALAKNHTVLGVHLIGNCAEVDSSGFVIPTYEIVRLGDAQYFQRLFSQRPACVKRIPINCWVCEKWVETTFTFKGNSDYMSLHLDIDHFAPYLMEKGQDFFTVKRAVPPKTITFFFTAENRPVLSEDYDTVNPKSTLSLTLEFLDGTKGPLNVKTLNRTHPVGNTMNLKSPFETKPRVLSAKIQTAIIIKRVPWDPSKSVFAAYKHDTDKLLNDCFEYDWKESKLPVFLKDPEQQSLIKELLKKHYKSIKDTYKYLSTLSVNEMPCIGTNIFGDFIQKGNILDTSFSFADLGVNWNAVNVTQDKNHIYNIPNYLVRYKFLEILVRIALDKFYRTKAVATQLAAVSLLLDSLLPFMSPFDTGPFRVLCHCESVDMLFRAYSSVLDCVFSTYSGKKALPGQKPFMSLEEWKSLVNETGLMDGRLTARDLEQCYYKAMMTQLDELCSKRFMEMSKVEFYEAWCRLSGLLQCTGPSSSVFETNSVAEEDLVRKIENALPKLLALCPRWVRDSFLTPTAEYYHSLMYKATTK